MDPYVILNVPKDVSREALKAAYTKKALRYHPDKKHGCKKKFHMLNKAYKKIKNEICSRPSSFEELKERSLNESRVERNKEPPSNSFGSGDNFDIKLFNKQFENDYIAPLEKPELPALAPQQPTHVKGDVAVAYKNFVNAHAKPKSKCIITTNSGCRESNSLGFDILGQTKVDDYTDYTNKSLPVTDFRKSYTLEYVDDVVVDDKHINIHEEIEKRRRINV